MNPSEDGDRRRRRSPRLHAQAHASDAAVGVPRLHPQVHASEEGARSQIHATGEGAGVIHASGSLPAALASPIEDDDLLREILLRLQPSSPIEVDDLLRDILLRLPPQPTSLLWASAVCKQWRCNATDPKFLHCFRLHHRRPPLLGFFHRLKNDIVFTPIMVCPDRIPPKRFDLHLRDMDSHNMRRVRLLDCRHGRVLLVDKLRDEVIGPDEVIVCDPITGEQRRVTVPPRLRKIWFDGAVLCAAIDKDHVHGSCHSSPFNVVLISNRRRDKQAIACVYSSGTGIWGDIISTPISCELSYRRIPGLFVGNALYWLRDSISDGMLKFDLAEQSLAVISGPPITDDDFPCDSHCIIQAEDDAVGFAILSYPHLQMWQRNIICHGVTPWVLWKTIDIRAIVGLPKPFKGQSTLVRRILGCLEDSDEILLSVGRGIYVVQLKSMKAKKLCEDSYLPRYCSFKSFYPPGTSIAGGFDGAEMMHDSQGD